MTIFKTWRILSVLSHEFNVRVFFYVLKVKMNLEKICNNSVLA